jgi:hypothetical protein
MAGIFPVTLEVTDGNTSLSTTLAQQVHVIADPGIASPIMEGFETMTALPGNGWRTRGSDPGHIFQVTNSTAFSGDRSVQVLNGPSYSGNITELLAPSVDLSEASEVRISFRYAYAQRTPTDDDRLKVMLSINCGVHWSLRRQLRGIQDLVSAEMTNGYFIPQSEDEWRLCELNIPIQNFLQSDLLIKFQFESKGGNNLYIDDININAPITGITETDLAEGAVTLFPNPTAGSSSLYIELVEGTNISVQVTDMLGRNMKNIAVGDNGPGAHHIHLDLQELAAGSYLVTVELNERSRTFKLIKDDR